MRRFPILSLLALVAACGQPSGSEAKDAQAKANLSAAAATESSALQANMLTPAEKTAIFAALSMNPDAQGQIENECGEMVSPQFLSGDLGGPIGAALIVVIPGGPNTITCYGDGPGLLTILKHEGDAFRTIFQDRGGIAILPGAHLGAHDIALGGPGFSFPLFQWNGTEYAPANKTISDKEFGEGKMLP